MKDSNGQQSIDKKTARSLLENVSFELETDLRLHPQKLDLGKSEQLNDALTLPFTDIEAQLNRYITSERQPKERRMLQRSMKVYLARLNANALIPLRFRLKVLNTFERDLDLFDAEMTAAILNAHKIGVEMVQKAARDERAYYPVLVDMVCNALELSTRVLHSGLERYQTPPPIAIRQSYDLMRLGLTVLPLLPPEAEETKSNLHRTISTHELLRVLDFFSKSRPLQQETWKILQKYNGLPEAHFIRRGERPDLQGNHFLIVNMNRPNLAGTLAETSPEPRLYDCIVICLDGLLNQLRSDVRWAEALRQDPERQKRDLTTEEALHSLIVGGKAILNALCNRVRKTQRRHATGVTLDIEWNLIHAFREAYASVDLDSYAYVGRAATEQNDTWSVVNINAGGVGLERSSEDSPEQQVGAMVGLNWSPHHGEPRLGEIKWIRQPRHGEQRMGIQFLKPGYSLLKARLVGTGSRDLNTLGETSILLKSLKKRLIAILPGSRIIPHMVFHLHIRNQDVYLKVERIIRSGANYSICRMITVARENLDDTLSLDS